MTMRPRILHDLSRHLAIRLEEGIRGGAEENPVPVYLCHPLDLAHAPAVRQGDRASGTGGRSGGHVAGALYLSRIAPARRFRQAGRFAERDAGPGLPARARRFGVWTRLRFGFMVIGGSHEEELGALAAALQTLDSMPFISLEELGSSDGSLSSEVDAVALEIVDDDGLWRELGMDEHRLAVVFEVTLPLQSREVEPLATVVDRDLAVVPRDDGGGA